MNLSKYCYDKLWFPSFSYSFNLQYKLCDNGTKYRVWPSNAPLLYDNFKTIPIGGRYSEYRMRLDFDAQCKHDLCVDDLDTIIMTIIHGKCFIKLVGGGGQHFAAPFNGGGDQYLKFENVKKYLALINDSPLIKCDVMGISGD